MKSVLSFKDAHLGNIYLVIPKIREISKGLGSVTVTFDNGDKRNIESKNSEELMKEIVGLVEKYYMTMKPSLLG